MEPGPKSPYRFGQDRRVFADRFTRPDPNFPGGGVGPLPGRWGCGRQSWCCRPQRSEYRCRDAFSAETEAGPKFPYRCGPDRRVFADRLTRPGPNFPGAGAGPLPGRWGCGRQSWCCRPQRSEYRCRAAFPAETEVGLKSLYQYGPDRRVFADRPTRPGPNVPGAGMRTLPKRKPTPNHCINTGRTAASSRAALPVPARTFPVSAPGRFLVDRDVDDKAGAAVRIAPNLGAGMRSLLKRKPAPSPRIDTGRTAASLRTA